MAGSVVDAFAGGWWGDAGAAVAAQAGCRRAAVVAVPVHDEERRIVACLERLAGRAAAPCSLSVILLLNNCRDGTAAAVRSVKPRLSCPVTVLEIELPAERAHVGWARRLVMDEAAAALEAGGRDDGLILTTDADTLVDHDWVAATLAAVDAGADAVAGALAFDPEEESALPLVVRRRARMERRFAALTAEIDARLDPVAHDPRPTHRVASGASLAVTLAAYRRVGGLPPVPVGEDRAFVDRLMRRDLRVRHSPTVRVTTSCRAVGRAAGGMADTLRRQAAVPDLPCDPSLEAVEPTCRRARWRAAIRRLALTGRLQDLAVWAPPLRLARSDAATALATPWVGDAWARIEALSPLLRRVPLHPSGLAEETVLAEALLRRPAALTAAATSGAARRADTPALDAA